MKTLRPKPPTLSQLQALVDGWNAEHPIGTPVKRYKYMNPQSEPELQITKTTSLAYVLGGHTAVIMVENKSGCVALATVMPTETEALKH